MKTKNVRAKALNSRLAAYSATATAALLIVPAAKATIQNITLADLTSGGTAGTVPVITSGTLSFSAGPFDGGLGLIFTSFAELIGQFATVAHSGAIHRSINQLAGNTPIVGLNFAGGSHAFYTTRGPASGAITAYVGFKTQKSAQNYYGWLRVQENFGANGLPQSLQLISKIGNPNIFGAYGTSADNVWAGQIVATPEPSVAALGGLALLACGAAGVREMRRRRQTENTNSD